MTNYHGRWRQIWSPHKCIRNAFVMLKFGYLCVMVANLFGNLKFVITFIHNTKVKHKLRICQVYKSEGPVDNKDLCVMQIPNMPWKFAVPTYLLSKSKFGNELAVFANWITYLNIMNALRMHLCGLQIWRRLPCLIRMLAGSQYDVAIQYWKIKLIDAQQVPVQSWTIKTWLEG